MITTVTTAFKNAIAKDSRSFELYFVDQIGNKYDIAKASFNFPYSPSVFKFGAVSSASIDCEVLTNSLVKNQIVSLRIKEKSVKEEVVLREFKITETKKIKSVNQPMMRVVAYDRINFLKLKKGKVYYSTLGKTTINKIWLDMYDKIDDVGFPENLGFASYAGKFKDIVVDSSIFSGYNIRDAMSLLASYVGANFVVNNKGKIELKELTRYDSYSLLNYNRIAEPQLDEYDTIINYLVAKKSDEETLTAGSTTSGEGLVLTNPAMTSEMLQGVLDNLKTQIPEYRVANINYLLADPTIAGGDIIPLRDENGEIVTYIPVMEAKYTFDGGLSCTIVSNKPDENEKLTLAEKISFSLKASTDSKIYAESAIDFSEAMAQGMGMHISTRTDSTGATIYYLHDKVDLEKSEKIWKVTSKGIGFATSYPGNFVMGVNEEGNILTNMLTVYTIKADQIDSGAITADKIGTGEVTADKIKVDDLNAVSARIGTFKIGKFTLYRPSQPSKDPEENFNYGFGLSGTTYAFWAGYLSNSNIYDSEATNPGSPYEQDGAFKREFVNLYIHRNGTLGLKKNTFYDSYYSTEIGDYFSMEHGGINLYPGVSDAKISLFANQISVKVNSEGKIEQKIENVFSHIIHTNPLTNTRTNKEYQHEFDGRVLFNNGIIVEDNKSGGTFIDSPRYNISTTYSLNGFQQQLTSQCLGIYKDDSTGVPTAIALGNLSNSVDTRIYAGTKKVIRMMNDVYIRNNTSIYFGIGTYEGSTVWNNMLHCVPGIDEHNTNAEFYIGDENRRINTTVNASGLTFKISGCRFECPRYHFEKPTFYEEPYEEPIKFYVPDDIKVIALIPNPEGGQKGIDVLKYDSMGLHLGNDSTNIYAYSGIYHSSGASMLWYTIRKNLVLGDSTNVEATYLRAKDNIRCEASMRIISGKGISLASDDTDKLFDMALYRSISSADLQGVGVYVGIENVPLRLRGDIYSTKYTTPILKVSGSNNLVLGDTAQGGRTYIYSKGTPMMCVSDSNNLIIGSDSSPIGETYIYSKTYIFAKSDIRIDNGKGIEMTNDGKNWSRVLYYAKNSELDGEGVYVGIDSKNLYLRGVTVEADDFSVNGVLTVAEMYSLGGAAFYSLDLYDRTGDGKSHSTAIRWDDVNGYAGVHFGISGEPHYYWGKYHHFFNTLRVPSISFDVDGTWRAAAQYGNKTHSSGEVRTGFHFGIAKFNTYIWGTPFLSNGVSITSDANLKNTIENLDDNYEQLFYGLKAKTFKYNDGTSDRKHLGFIAQEVKTAIDNSGLTTQDVGAYVADTNQADGSDLLALRYSEFVALNTHMIQKCLAKISSLEDEIKLLKETINNG